MNEQVAVMLTKEEVIHLSELCWCSRSKFSKRLARKFDLLARNQGWLDEPDYEDNRWRDGHPMDFGDR